MRFRFAVYTVMVLTLESCVSFAQSIDSEWLQTQISDVRDEVKLVGVGATVVVHGKLVAEAVSGKRRQNSEDLLTVDDKWHLGSITKSMTATVIGRLVERNLLTWDARLPELLPKMASDLHPGWNAVTLHHLLTHTAGLPPNFSVRTQFIRGQSRERLHETRREELMRLLREEPASAAGETMTYSNVGYTLAGFIAAEVTGTTWEDLMEKELFRPLELKSAGFGPPVGNQETGQPWGHQRVLFMRSPVDPGGLADNSPLIGPAGIVNMSMRDLARYGWRHLQGESADGEYLKARTFQKLHQGFVDDYACGWVEWDRDWADGRVIWHNGSNTFWYALVMLVPSRNAVLVIVTNDGHISEAGPAFFNLAEKIVAALAKRESAD